MVVPVGAHVKCKAIHRRSIEATRGVPLDRRQPAGYKADADNEIAAVDGCRPPDKKSHNAARVTESVAARLTPRGQPPRQPSGPLSLYHGAGREPAHLVRPITLLRGAVAEHLVSR